MLSCSFLLLWDNRAAGSDQGTDKTKCCSPKKSSGRRRVKPKLLLCRPPEGTVRFPTLRGSVGHL